MKYLNDYPKQTLSQIKALVADGLNYSKIEAIMQKDGYVNARGKAITRQDISHFMIKHGIRVYNRRTEALAPRKKRTTSGVTAPATYLKDVESIVTSNLEPHLKERLLKAMV